MQVRLTYKNCQTFIVLFSDMFRIWANIFFISILKLSVISLCCVFRCRIPRTKTEIEANSRRKYLLKNFNAKLQQIKAADLDDMDYRNGELKQC